MLFIDRAITEYYNMTQSIEVHSDLEFFPQVKNYYEKLIDLENLDLPRFKVHLKANKNKKRLEKLWDAFDESKVILKGQEIIFQTHKNLFEKRKKYFFECLEIEKCELVDFFFEKGQPKDKNALNCCIDTIIEEKHFFAGRLYQQMIIFIELMQLTRGSTTHLLRLDFHKNLQERLFEFVKSRIVSVNCFSELQGRNPSKEHVEIATKLRGSAFFEDLFEIHQWKVTNETLFHKPKWNPFFFQEVFQKRKLKNIPSVHSFRNLSRAQSIPQSKSLNTILKSSLRPRIDIHVIVLVHGYMGSRYDMRVLQNHLAKIIPQSVVLVSTSNEDMEKVGIETLCTNLANEVEQFLITRRVAKLSFVGHSLGGVIIRGAILRLKKYKDIMQSFLSLSSPHLGCRKNKSFLVSMGMKFLNKVRKESIINELQLDDNKSFEKCFMYRLAENDCMSWFKNILLVSSPQDSYVPYESARIQPNETKKSSKTSKVMHKMSKLIWDKIDCPNMVRIDVDLRPQKRFEILFLLFLIISNI